MDKKQLAKDLKDTMKAVDVIRENVTYKETPGLSSELPEEFRVMFTTMESMLQRAKKEFQEASDRGVDTP